MKYTEFTKTKMERTVIQCNMFSAMLAVRNFHFLDEACRLLIRERNTTDILDQIAYDKLLNALQKVDNIRVRRLLDDHKIKYLCTVG